MLYRMGEDRVAFETESSWRTPLTGPPEVSPGYRQLTLSSDRNQWPSRLPEFRKTIQTVTRRIQGMDGLRPRRAAPARSGVRLHVRREAHAIASRRRLPERLQGEGARQSIATQRIGADRAMSRRG